MHEGQKNHICELCGAKFGIKKSLERHVGCQHEDYWPHDCKYCQKAFHTLQKHISGHIKGMFAQFVMHSSTTKIMLKCT